MYSMKALSISMKALSITEFEVGRQRYVQHDRHRSMGTYIIKENNIFRYFMENIVC